MQAFKVQGTFPMGYKKDQPFTIEVVADDEAAARERAYALMGSRHRVNRRQVKINGLEALASENVQNDLVRLELGLE